MLTNRLRRGFAVVLSVSLLAAGTVTAFAAPGDDAWGEPPEGFTFEADNVGPTVYATPNTNSNTSGNTTNGNAAARIAATASKSSRRSTSLRPFATRCSFTSWKISSA